MLAAALLLAGCQPAAPASAPVQPGASSAAGAAPEATAPGASEQAPQEAPPASASQSSQPPASAPQPDTPPQATAGAITLPESIVEIAADGYTAEALTPAQYDLNFPLNRGGFRGFQTCEFFFLGQNEELLRQKDEIESVIAECSVSEEEKDAMRGELELLLSFLEYNRIDATAGRLSCWAVRPHSSTAKAHGHSVLPRCCICTGGKAEILTKK